MKFSTNKSTVSPGEIQFYDAIEPPLKAGAYTLSAKQTIDNVPNPDGPVQPSYSTEQDFLLKGPQFAIKDTIIHSRYPAPVSTGRYSAALPNLVLTDFALPWSRNIDSLNPSQPDEIDTPWMGLLTIYPDEYVEGAKAISSTNKILGPKSVSITELLTPTETNVMGPALDAADIGVSMDTKVTVVDMDFATFQAISPTLDELEFLAHGRAVNTGGKVMLGMDADGFFSLLIGNRLPKAGTAKTPAKNWIFAVSYEGHSEYLRGGKNPPTSPVKKDLIRLVLLTSWSFKVTESVSSFLSEMKDLCLQGNGGVNLMQMPGDHKSISDDVAKEAIEIGYTALQNDYRDGEKATSWYRGPLVASPTKRDFEYGTYLYSDHAMHYDPSTGIFDHTYSSAWQIGRLLALSDASFAQSFFRWRNNYINKVIRAASTDTVSKNAQIIAGDANTEKDISLPRSLQYFLAKHLKDDTLNWPKFKDRREIMLGDHLPGVLPADEIKRIQEEEEDPLIALHNLIK